jgi:hypothetical protein
VAYNESAESAPNNSLYFSLGMGCFSISFVRSLLEWYSAPPGEFDRYL